MLKRLALSVLTIATIAISSGVYATEVTVDWGNEKDPITILVNEKEVSVPRNEPPPFIDEKGRTQVPIRFVSEALGCKVDWDGTAKSVTITKADGKNLKLYIGKSEALKNGEKIYFDTVPRLQNDRTFVPARFISENLFEATVSYDPSTKIVSIVIDKELTISSDFKKIRDILGNDNVYINKTFLLYSHSGTPSHANSDIDIGLEDDKSLNIGVSNFKAETINAIKEIMKIYYPTEYESVYSKFMEVVNGEIQYNKETLEYKGLSGYFDGKYFKATKFEDGISIYIGGGVEY